MSIREDLFNNLDMYYQDNNLSDLQEILAVVSSFVKKLLTKSLRNRANFFNLSIDRICVQFCSVKLHLHIILRLINQ